MIISSAVQPGLMGELSIESNSSCRLCIITYGTGATDDAGSLPGIRAFKSHVEWILSRAWYKRAIIPRNFRNTPFGVKNP